MSSLCTALDLLQTGGVTSGICVMVQRFLVPKFMDKNFNGCFRNTLAACFALCFAFASEFGMLVVQLFSWMYVFDSWFDSFFNNKLKPTFSAKLRFAFFWKLHLVYNNFVEKNNVFGIYEKFEMILECLW